MTLFKYRKNNPLIFFALVFSFLVISPVFVQAQSKNSKKELEKKKKQINEEINEINKELEETKTGKKASLNTLVKLNVKLKKRQSLINTINMEINALNAGIRENENHVQNLKTDLERLKKEYAKMIVFAQRNQNTYSKLMFIFSAENFNQAYARLKYIQQYSEFRRKQADEIIKTQTKLIGKLNELKVQHQEKKMLLMSEETEKKQLSQEKNQQEEVLTSLQQKEKELKKQLEKKKRDAAELQLAIKRLIEEELKRKAEEEAKALAAKKAKEAEEKKDNKTVKKEDKKIVEKKATASTPALDEVAVALSADFASNRGKLPFPVVKGVICEEYGEHEHPAIKGFMMFNNGVDICVSKGTQVRAIFDGEVTGIADSPTGGKLVIVRHGEYLSVYSNISNVSVNIGQKVKSKQTIGTVLFDEDEGKSSMSLQIWKGQKTMDPSAWLYGAR